MRRISSNILHRLFESTTWRLRRVVAGLLIGALLGACGKEESARLTLTGSSTIAPLAAEIGKRFEAENPGTRIDVQTGGSSRGIADARSGLADIGMASRALEAEEQDLLAHTIALDGVSMIVHARNREEVERWPDSRAVYRADSQLAQAGRTGCAGTTSRVQQSLLSHHLQALRRAGFVTARRSGKRVLYRLANNVAADPAASELNLGCCRLSFD